MNNLQKNLKVFIVLKNLPGCPILGAQVVSTKDLFNNKVRVKLDIPYNNGDALMEYGTVRRSQIIIDTLFDFDAFLG